MVAQHKVIAGADGGLGDLTTTREGGGAYRLAIDGESRQMDIGSPQRLLDILRVEPRETTDTAKEDGAIGGCARGTVAELIALQTVVGKVVHLCALLGIEEGETVVGRYPQHTFTVALDRGDTIGGQSVGSGVFGGLFRLQIVAEEARTRAIPQLAIVFAGYTDRHTIVETVDTKGLGPTATGDIETTDAHRRGHIEAFPVRRNRDLGNEVVDNAVDTTIDI